MLNLLDIPAFNHQVHITKGILEEECSQMLSGFFKELREKKEEKQRSCIKMQFYNQKLNEKMEIM